MTNPKVLETMARAIYDEFDNRPLYAQAQMNGVIADECAQAALQALLEGGWVVEQGWQPIETAPHDGGLYIVGPAGGDYGWYTASWAQDTVLGGQVLAGWREDGIWLDPQPTHWFDVPTPPVSTFLEQGDQEQPWQLATTGDVAKNLESARDHDPSTCAASVASDLTGQQTDGQKIIDGLKDAVAGNFTVRSYAPPRPVWRCGSCGAYEGQIHQPLCVVPYAERKW